MERQPGDLAGTGAGGKTTRRSFRARPSPYDRPQREGARPQQRPGPDRWFSKLLVRPVSRILPSLFSMAPRNLDSMPPESLSENDHIELEDVDGDTTIHLEDQFLESKVFGASRETSLTKPESEGNELVGDKQRGTNNSVGLDEVEQHLKHKMFTRDESDRLMQLLRSRTADLSDGDGHAARSTVEAAEVTRVQNDSRTLVNAVGPRITMNTAQPFTPSQKKPRTLVKEDDVDHQTPLLTSEPYHLTAHDASSSPVDIARAYMEAQKSASGYGRQNGILKNENRPIDRDGSALALSSAVKSPMCWPGAVVHGDHGYSTPQIQRSRIGLRDFPRSPYSGALFSKSSSKFQGVGERSNLLSAGRKQSYTPVFGSNKSKSSSVLDDGPAQVNPIRHVRQRSMLATASEVAGPSNQSPAPSSVSKGSYRDYPSTPEGSSRFTVGSTVHPQSSKMAQKILEHLDRPVFPKEKSLELELALARTKPPSKHAAVSMDGQDKRSDLRIADSPKTGYSFGSVVSTQETEHPPKVFPWPYTGKAQDKEQPSSTPAASELFQMPKSQAPSRNDTVPTPVFALKSSDNGYGFTFPVPPASNFFSEPPPTPTMNSSLAATRTLPVSDETIPAFSFGTLKADDRLVFSFGSTAGSTVTDTAAPIFKFGSEEKRELSFRSVANDAICY